MTSNNNLEYTLIVDTSTDDLYFDFTGDNSEDETDDNNFIENRILDKICCKCFTLDNIWGAFCRSSFLCICHEENGLVRIDSSDNRGDDYEYCRKVLEGARNRSFCKNFFYLLIMLGSAITKILILILCMPLILIFIIIVLISSIFE
jgi:hypothetical protein